MREKIVKLYKYDELSETAQEKAREWFGRINAEDFSADNVYEDAATIAELMGLDIRQRQRKLGWGVSVYYSLHSQGAGASFDATWHACNVQPGKVLEHAPQDAELARIAGEFERIAKAYPTSRYSAKASGRYQSIDFDIDMDPAEDSDDVARTHAQWEVIRERDDKIADELREASRAFAHWIYKQVEADYDYQTTDKEGLADGIRANEYEFTDDGIRED